MASGACPIRTDGGDQIHATGGTTYVGTTYVTSSGRLVCSLFLLTLCAALPDRALGAARNVQEPNDIRAFLESHCSDCHGGPEPDGGLDLKKLSGDLGDAETAARWVRIFDRVQGGEMPPRDEEAPPKAETGTFLRSTAGWLQAAERQRYQTAGRVPARRLTNLQIERTLHDVLGVDIPLATHFSAPPRSHRYSTVADGQPMSRYQLEQHLTVVDLALDEAFRRALSADDVFKKRLNAVELSRRDARARTREPELLDDRGVVWSSGLEFYGRIPATTAENSGWYRVTVRASALKSPEKHGVWCTIRTGHCVSGSPQFGWVGAFEARPEPRQWTFETWLPRGEMFEIRPGDVTLARASFKGGQVGAGEGGRMNVPGLAIEWIEMERFHRGPGNQEIRRQLLGELDVVEEHEDWRLAQASSRSPRTVVRNLMTRFAERAFRRPVTSREVDPYVQLVDDALARGKPLLAAVRGGYRALLCSPRFLYFYELPGALDGHAMASRLSYFLWNRMPDPELRRLAAAGLLGKPQVLRAQVKRMLADPRGKDFVRDLASEWLDLSLIDFTEPDRRLFRTFDVVVQNSMLDETHSFLQAMVDGNLSVTHVVDSNFTFMNSRLSRFYDMVVAHSDNLQRVYLRPDSRRGGLLGHGAILKVTANGTATSPVVRGAWVSERLLGDEVPPPPDNVPAIEPDIRGAKSIREMLEKHRSMSSCASCHARIDPPGFALENFDPAGRWRDHYGASEKKGLRIDASYELSGGGAFKDVDGFRARISRQPEKLARNVAQQLLVYGTGAPIGFADREVVASIAKGARGSKYGFASLIEGVVTSSVFLRK